MANRDCCGDRFSVEGVRYYRCLWDNAVMREPTEQTCPNCKRAIDATEQGEIPYRLVTLITIPGGPSIPLPSAPRSEIGEGYPGIAHDLETMRTALVRAKDALHNPFEPDNQSRAYHEVCDALKNAAPQAQGGTNNRQSSKEADGPAVAALDVMSMRSALEALLEIAEQVVDTRRCSVGILRAMNDARRHVAMRTESGSREAALQAQIDRLMLEYCPSEMTPEQIENWKRHQRPVAECAHEYIVAPQVANRPVCHKCGQVRP